MAHLGEFLGCPGADAVAGAVGPHQQRKACLDLGIAAAQGIIGGVADFRRVLQLIVPVMLGDLFRQAVELLLGLGRGELVDRLHTHARLRAFFGGLAASAIRRLAAARASSVTLAPARMPATSSRRAPSPKRSMPGLSLTPGRR